MTDDGYYLHLFNVRAPTILADAPAIFFQHGIAADADTWVRNKITENNPAIRAAKEGYDVWLGNNRGSKYSRKHKTLDADVDYKQYYDYSFYELGEHDLPAMVDYVRA
jgi:lysosomal acid lipase/cholesteryl ester hydrolase